MTSSICANLDPETSLTTILQGLFPCGSITGAPKLSTLQLIQKIENYSRGVYSGAIGYILPNNEMQFSVAIRTLSAAAKQQQELTLGIGGGITVQATAEEEWQEILTKLKFVRKFYQPQFNLIESFLVIDGEIQNLNQHLTRLNNSAQRLIFKCNPKDINSVLLNYVAQYCHAPSRYKLRLELDHGGKFKIEHALIASNPEYLTVALAPYPLDTRHGLFRHKTDSRFTRGVYTQIDNTAKPQGIDELIFINQDGIITESRYHNVIIEYQGELITTPAEHGLLSGIFRTNLIREGKLKERAITREMLCQATAIFLCNDVRGMIPAQLLAME
jgi:para-aminobenzoate synthetase/4-amino-4-deoxychorismate lyase